MLVMSMSTADDLASGLQQRYEAFGEYLATLNIEQWRARSVPTPAAIKVRACVSRRTSFNKDVDGQ